MSTVRRLSVLGLGCRNGLVSAARGPGHGRRSRPAKGTGRFNLIYTLIMCSFYKLGRDRGGWLGVALVADLRGLGIHFLGVRFLR